VTVVVSNSGQCRVSATATRPFVQVELRDSNPWPSACKDVSKMLANCRFPGEGRFPCHLAIARCPWFPPCSGTRMARPTPH